MGRRGETLPRIFDHLIIVGGRGGGNWEVDVACSSKAYTHCGVG